MSFLSLLALGINGIIGSGVFILPGILAGNLGSDSLLVFVLCGILLIPIALVYYELSRKITRNGGPYNYALAAFGREAAFPVGWLNWFTCVISTSTVSSAFSSYLQYFLVDKIPILYCQILSALLICLFGWINTYGVQYGSKTMSFFTVIKILPLLLIIGATFSHFEASPSFQFLHSTSLGSSVLLTLYIYTGFEVIPVVSGEAGNSSRSIPRAILFSLLFCIVFYSLVQLCVLMTPQAIGSDRPLVVLAERLWGAGGGAVVGVTGLLSILGFISGSSLTSPRMLAPLSEDKLLPGVFGKEEQKHHVPKAAIWFSSLVAASLCFIQSMEELLELTTLTVAIQYLFISLCLAKVGGKDRKILFLSILSFVISSIFLYQVPGLAWKELFLALCVGYIFRGIFNRSLKKNRSEA